MTGVGRRCTAAAAGTIAKHSTLGDFTDSHAADIQRLHGGDGSDAGAQVHGHLTTPRRRRRCHRSVIPLDYRSYFYNVENMNEASAVAALAALAQEARLRVFRALVGAGPDGLTPGALSALLDIPASTLSFHLKELVHAGLVSAERDGRNLHYRPAFRQMNDLLAYLTAHCCMSQPCLPGATRRRSTC